MSVSLANLLIGSLSTAPGLPQEPVVAQSFANNVSEKSTPGFEEMMAMLGMMQPQSPLQNAAAPIDFNLLMDAQSRGPVKKGGMAAAGGENSEMMLAQVVVPGSGIALENARWNAALPAKDLEQAVKSLNQTAQKVMQAVPENRQVLAQGIDPTLLLKRAAEGPSSDLGEMSEFQEMSDFTAGPVEGAMIVKATPKMVPSNDFLAMRDLNQPKTREAAILAPKMAGVSPAVMELGLQPSAQRESMSKDLREFNESIAVTDSAPSMPFEPRAPENAAPVVLVSTETRSTGTPKMNAEAMLRIADAITTSAIRNPSGTSSEVRLRLKPEALGEVRVTVKNLGDRLDVRFESGSADARKVIETSLGDLRDRLTQGSFNVAHLEVQAPQISSFLTNAQLGPQMNSSMQQSFQQPSQQFMSGNGADQFSGQNSGRQFSDSSRDSDREAAMVSGLSARTQANPYLNAANGRLDVRA